MTKKITAEELKSLLIYDRSTGIFRWRFGAGGQAAGTIAGTEKSDGYVEIGIKSRSYRAHRLAWLYVHGVWPKNEIDHINGIRKDNRINNLREATKTQNQQNRSLTSAVSVSGLTGVFASANGRWVARIVVNRKRTTIGFFATKEEASAAYVRAKREMHPTCDRVKSEAADIAYSRLAALLGVS